MERKRINVIYIMGAGRSGSTILSTALGSSNQMFNCADLMQIYDYGCTNKKCNDGSTIFESDFWQRVLKIYDPENTIDYCARAKENTKIERHASFIRNYFGFTKKNDLENYTIDQEKLFRSIASVSKKNYIVDSSKFVNRALLLGKSKKINLKIIYNVRDSRGVINSFGKTVQTKKNPISSILYYCVINLMSELLFLTLPKAKKIRIRYEDLVSKQQNSIEKISKFLEVDLGDVLGLIKSDSNIEVGPVIEGNRMVKDRKIVLAYDGEWLTKLGCYKRLTYYLLTLPFMIVNKYKI